MKDKTHHVVVIELSTSQSLYLTGFTDNLPLWSQDVNLATRYDDQTEALCAAGLAGHGIVKPTVLEIRPN